MTDTPDRYLALPAVATPMASFVIQVRGHVVGIQFTDSRGHMAVDVFTPLDTRTILRSLEEAIQDAETR